MRGPVRQETLSGIPLRRQFDELRKVLSEDYEAAAGCYDLCRGKGIQGGLSLFTTDADLAGYARHLPLRLHRCR